MNLEQVISVRTDKTIYRDNNLAIKVFNEGYSKANVLNEALNQARVEETGLNIPKVREVTKIDGKWAIVADYIAGKTLEQLMKENPDKLDEYLELFLSLQIEVHNKRAPLLNKLKDKMKRKISEADLQPDIRYELHTRLESMPKHEKVCHGDFNPGNIIVGDDGKSYILDWSHATQGNASADVARSYLLFKLAKEDATAEKYINLFCKKSKTAINYVQQWLPIVAASQSVKGKTHEREFLLNWANVVDFS